MTSVWNVPTRLRVIGLDLSLTSCGMSDGYSHQVIRTNPEDALEARLDRVTRGVVAFAMNTPDWPEAASLAVIEAGAFARGSQSQAAEILAALRFMVRVRLWRLGIPFAMVAPTTLKLATTGNGHASKAHMVAAVDERYGTSFGLVPKSKGREDLADALALAALGYDRVRQPLACHFPAPPLTPVKVDWPELVSD